MASTMIHHCSPKADVETEYCDRYDQFAIRRMDGSTICLWLSREQANKVIETLTQQLENANATQTLPASV